MSARRGGSATGWSGRDIRILGAGSRERRNPRFRHPQRHRARRTVDPRLHLRLHRHRCGGHCRRVRVLRFLIDGTGVAGGDGIELNNLNGSAKAVLIQGGRIRNCASSTSSNELGVGVAAFAERFVISDTHVKNIGLDGFHFKNGGAGILIHDSTAEDCVRPTVIFQPKAGLVFEGVIAHDVYARRCLTGSSFVNPRGVFEITGSAGTASGNSLHDLTAVDCGNATKDSHAALLGSTTTYSRIDNLTSVRQLGTAATGGTVHAANLSGGTNVIGSVISY